MGAGGGGDPWQHWGNVIEEANSKYIGGLGDAMGRSIDTVLNNGYVQEVGKKVQNKIDSWMPQPATPVTPAGGTTTNTPNTSMATTTPQTSQSATYGTGQSGGSNTIHQTLLTGPGGVDPNSLTLGRLTLLGNSGGPNNG